MLAGYSSDKAKRFSSIRKPSARDHFDVQASTVEGSRAGDLAYLINNWGQIELTPFLFIFELVPFNLTVVDG